MDDRENVRSAEKDGDERTKALSAVEKIFEPLCTFMVRNGIGYKEANDILKGAFLQAVERDEFLANGREPNVSRTAVLTGLSRKEIAKRRRCKSAMEPENRERTTMSLPARVLAAWAHDSQFHGTDGTPMSLGFPDGDPSFSQLLRTVGADLPPTALISELVKCGSVIWDGSDRLRMVRQSYRPLPSDDYHSVRYGECVRDLQNTLLENMDSSENTIKLLERRAWTEHLPVGSFEHFHRAVERLAEDLLGKADAWLTAAEPRPNQANQSPAEEKLDSLRAGVGVYVFREF